MTSFDVTQIVLFPHLQTEAGTSLMNGMDATRVSALSPGKLGLIVAMWWTMMIAMMAPSATPAILLYAAVFRRATADSPVQPRLAPTGAFAAGYLIVWLAFSLAAAALQALLATQGSLSATMMGSQSRWLSAAILGVAGFYELSRLKRSCLSKCRSPAMFMSRNWRPGTSGAVRLGVLHGAYCVGCCWALMALLFVGGVMDVVWIAALTLLVAAEKLIRVGPQLSQVIGFILVAWATATLLV